MISRLKQHLGLNTHKVRGLRNMAVHVPPCIIAVLLVALVALRLKRVEKTRCIALIGW
jgi:hypothetical protein